MKTTLAVLVLCASIMAQTTNVVKTSQVSVVAFEVGNDGHFQGAVRFSASVKGDQAIVRVFYWQDHPDFGRLLRSQEFVIPVVPGVTVMFGDVPAQRNDVRNVDVTLVKNLSKQSFDKFEGESR